MANEIAGEAKSEELLPEVAAGLCVSEMMRGWEVNGFIY